MRHVKYSGYSDIFSRFANSNILIMTRIIPVVSYPSYSRSYRMSEFLLELAQLMIETLQ